MVTLYGLQYDAVLDMIASLSWQPDTGRTSLGAEAGAPDPVQESIERFSEIVYRLIGHEIEDITSIIPRGLFEADSLISAKHAKAIIAEVCHVLDFLDIDQKMIGVESLCTLAHALVLRNTFPDKWNSFCHSVGKVAWIIETDDQPSGASGSTGPIKATFSGKVAQNGASQSQDYIPERIRENHPRLAAAADDHGFNESVERLLAGKDQEGDEAERAIITGDDSHPPPRISRFNPVIQAKYSAARYRKKGR